MNPLQELSNFGQSFWVDYILRSLITSGELDMHINDPEFAKAMADRLLAMLGSVDF